jgi:hypothetical protein
MSDRYRYYLTEGDSPEREVTKIGDSPAHVSYWGIHCYLTAYRRKGASSIG